MIVCQRHHLEARCRERGYTFDQVRPCIVHKDGDTLTVDEAHPAYPRAKPGPSVVRKAISFAAAAARHVAAGMPRASDDEIQRRFAICQTNACGQFDGKACRQCGCPISRERLFVSKLAWANEKCPAGLWGPVS